MEYKTSQSIPENKRVWMLAAALEAYGHVGMSLARCFIENYIKGVRDTQNWLAVSIGVPPRRINEIAHGKRAITADTAVRP